MKEGGKDVLHPTSLSLREEVQSAGRGVDALG